MITALSVLSLLSATNAGFMQTPRVLYAMSRDGLFLRHASSVNERGTPTVALAMCTGVEIVLVLSGSFARLLAVTAFFFVMMYGSGFVALFRLRRSAPDLPRPFRAWGYPWTTAAALLLSILFLAGVIVGDPGSALAAVAAVAASYPVFILIRRVKPA